MTGPAAATLPRRWPKTFYALGPAGAAVLALAAVEIGLRTFRPVPYAPEHNMVFDVDPDTGRGRRNG
jgi:hypothetical protein